jgi:hypothetical protein
MANDSPLSVSMSIARSNRSAYTAVLLVSLLYRSVGLGWSLSVFQVFAVTSDRPLGMGKSRLSPALRGAEGEDAASSLGSVN